jgi:hypothetical protein
MQCTEEFSSESEVTDGFSLKCYNFIFFVTYNVSSSNSLTHFKLVAKEQHYMIVLKLQTFV